MSTPQPFFVRSFLDKEEAAALSEWINNKHRQPFFSDAGMGGARRTTRYSYTGFEFPPTSFAVRDRLQKVFAEFGGFAAPFKDGMVASCAYPGDTCRKHTDPAWERGHITVHCNVIVSAPDAGGEAVIGGKTFAMPERDLLCYPVSMLPHETLRVDGSRPRLMWVFGFCLPDTTDWGAFSFALKEAASLEVVGHD